MMIFDSRYLISVYEELRLCVLGGHYTFTRPPGLDLFLKKGFLKWIEVQKETEVLTSPVKKPDTIREFLPQDKEQEITLILANMVLEERSSYVST